MSAASLPARKASPTTVVEIRQRIAFLQAEAANWQMLLDKKSCWDCDHFAHGRVCAVANGRTPPAHVQQTGCPSWTYDQIPF